MNWVYNSLRHQRPCTSLELKFQVVFRCPTWVLGTKLRASIRAEHTMNWGAISPASAFYLFTLCVHEQSTTFLPWTAWGQRYLGVSIVFPLCLFQGICLKHQIFVGPPSCHGKFCHPCVIRITMRGEITMLQNFSLLSTHPGEMGTRTRLRNSEQ